MTFIDQEKNYLFDIDLAIERAGRKMDMLDLDRNQEIDDEELETIYAERQHCGICQTRTVLEEVWPSVEAYINWLRSQIQEAS